MILGALPILILLISILLPKNKETEKASKWFMILCSITVMLFVGLRSRYTGSGDTNNYARIFERVRGVSFSKAVIAFHAPTKSASKLQLLHILPTTLSISSFSF